MYLELNSRRGWEAIPFSLLPRSPCIRLPAMCKNYIYHTVCHNRVCDTIVSKKSRNVYCREALDARCLGHCMTGVVIAQQLFNRHSSARCRCCKSLARPQNQSTKTISIHSSSLDTVLPERIKRNAECLLEHVFEFPLEIGATNQQHDESAYELEDGATEEVYMVQSPEPSEDKPRSKRRTKARSDKSKECPQPIPNPEPLVDPYKLQHSYQLQETWSRQI